LFELVAGVLLAIGLMTRLVSIVLFVFVGLTIFFFYHEFTDPLQGTLALNSLAIMGGLLMTFAYGQCAARSITCASAARPTTPIARRARRRQGRRRDGRAAPVVAGQPRPERWSPMSTATACPR
jgi:putative oxidoreductase